MKLAIQLLVANEIVYQSLRISSCDSSDVIAALRRREQCSQFGCRIIQVPCE